jgi:hypothetical protein
MKVQGPTSSSLGAGVRASRTVADGFELLGGEMRAAASSHAAAASATASLDMLLALQEEATPQERRRRAARRGHGILDALDALKLAAFDGVGLDGTALQALRGAVRSAREQTDDPGLDDVLDQIEVRAAVELAKREQAGRI